MINDFFTFIQARKEKKIEENIGNFLLLQRIYSKKMLMLVDTKMENFFFLLRNKFITSAILCHRRDNV